MAASIRNSPQTASCFTRAGPARKGVPAGWFQDEDKARRKLRMSPAELSDALFYVYDEKYLQNPPEPLR